MKILKLKQFDGERKNEISMIRVAKAVMEEKGEVLDFNEIVSEVAKFIEIDEAEMNRRMPQFYTDLNVDGEFISLGENKWGLRNWYPVDSINEVLTHENDEEDIIPTISPDGFDEYEDPTLERVFEDELDESEEEAADETEEKTFADIDGDGVVENLDDYQDDIDDADDLVDDTELDGLAIVDEDELLDEDLDEEEF